MKTKFSLYTAIALVIANMVGTGVFTSLGFQVISLSSGSALLLLWLIGGLIALFGALAYSEAGVMMPRSGGEYHFLSKMYHPLPGFLAGWVSFLVGFAAPVAAAAIALGNYLCSSLGWPKDPGLGIAFLSTPSLIAIAVVVLFTLIHSTNKIVGANFQNIITSAKVLIIFVLIAIGLAYGKSSSISFVLDKNAFHDILSPAFVVSMFFVTFSYSGWNAAAYVADEIKNPLQNIPLSLIGGTGIVVIMYVLLNFVFLYTVPAAQLSGKIEVGFIYASRVFGAGGGKIMGSLISVLLLSTISSMVIAGPRISKVIGEDYRLFRWMAKKSAKDIPYVAIITQGIFSILYIMTSTFDQMIIFIGFTLNLFTFLTVLGVIIMRVKHPEIPRAYKTWGYPVTPVVFLAINIWILVYGLLYRPYESLAGLGFTASGVIVYFINKKIDPGFQTKQPGPDLPT